MSKYQVFRKYVFEADDLKSARKIWQSAAAEGNEENMMEYEGFPKVIPEESGSIGKTVRRQVFGR